VYGEIRDKVLPYFRRELESARALFAIEKGHIEKLGAFVAKLDAACAALKDLARESKGTIGSQPFTDVLARGHGSKGLEVDPMQACAEFSDWIGGMSAATNVRLAVQTACASCTEAGKCAEEFISVFATGIEFWELVLDFYLCDYVFEHAEMKYKMKLCRDFIKFFPQVTKKGDAFLTLYDAGKFDLKQNTELMLQWANEVYEQSQNRLQFYRRIKAVAESSGIAQAFEEWKQAVAYSKKLAQ